MFSFAKSARCLALGAALALSVPASGVFVETAQAASVVAVVNGSAITSGDLSKRVAFLRLQRTKGNLNQIAKQQLIDDVLKREEILRLGASVSTQEVDAAFQRFAASNKLSPQQLSKILNQAGVTVAHFKSYIAVSMSWPRAVSARYGAGGTKSTQELVERMTERGEKPKTDEFMLQQIIFVVPENKRGSLLGKRKREAEAARKKFPGCDQAKVFAATMHDVSVRNLGRFLEPELPDRWSKLVTKTNAGGTTAPLVTEKGVEFLAVCSRRVVSDDAAAQAVFEAEDLKNPAKQDDANSEAYLKELRAKAQIIKK